MTPKINIIGKYCIFFESTHCLFTKKKSNPIENANINVKNPHSNAKPKNEGIAIQFTILPAS